MRSGLILTFMHRVHQTRTKRSKKLRMKKKRKYHHLVSSICKMTRKVCLTKLALLLKSTLI